MNNKEVAMGVGDLFLWLGKFNPYYYKASKCGHRTRLVGKVSAYGRTITTKITPQAGNSPDYCHECLGKMAIRCAWCGEPLFIGDPITLYTLRGDVQIPEYAVVYNKDPLHLVGCLGWNCADTGADRAGFWVPGESGQGMVHRVPTAVELLFGPDKPSMIIDEDLSDMTKKSKLIP